jgi:hypothetical protein
MASSLQKHIPHCSTCGDVVALEVCKIDEHGRAVHEECYLAKINLQNGNSPAEAESSLSYSLRGRFRWFYRRLFAAKRVLAFSMDNEPKFI